LYTKSNHRFDLYQRLCIFLLTREAKLLMEEEQSDFVIPVKTDTDEFVLRGRPCELSSFSFVPPERHAPRERTYFNVDKNERYSAYGYDRIFHQERDFNAKLHRDDREHAKSQGLQVHQEEISKPVPTLYSSVYGKRLSNQLDPRIGRIAASASFSPSSTGETAQRSMGKA
ncbi:hypothetical protein BOX15_Mlig001719g5, partial [Macrostomum lignano]